MHGVVQFNMKQRTSVLWLPDHLDRTFIVVLDFIPEGRSGSLCQFLTTICMVLIKQID